MIQCEFCKTENSLDRILCVSCGKKLNFDQPQILEAAIQKSVNNKPQANIKVKMADDSFFKPIIKIIIFCSICTSIFLVLYNGHITFKELDIGTVKSLNKKLHAITINPAIKYISFNVDEINLLIERKLASTKLDIDKLFLKFFKFQKCFITINSYDIDFHLIFKILNRDISFTFKGLIMIHENLIGFKIIKTYIGKHIIPQYLVLKIFKPLIESLSKNQILKIPESISSIKIEKKLLNVYLVDSNLNNDISLESNDNVPIDVLLIQAGDSFFNYKYYSLSLKYYNLALAYVPNSPLKDYVKKQMRTIKENI